MPSAQIIAKVDKSQKTQFERITRSIGTTPANALKMFIVKFNNTQGFPFDLRIEDQYIEELEDILVFNSQIKRETLRIVKLYYEHF